MKFTITLILMLTMISCKDRGQEKSSSTMDTLRQNPNEEPVIEKKPRRPQAGLILSSDNVKIFGDTTIEKEKIYLPSIKFEPYVAFEDFKVDKIDKVKADLNLSSNKQAYRFRTRKGGL